MMRQQPYGILFRSVESEGLDLMGNLILTRLAGGGNEFQSNL